MINSREDFEKYLFRKYKDSIDFELAKEICSREFYQDLVSLFISVHQSVPKFIQKINENNSNNRIVKTI